MISHKVRRASRHVWLGAALLGALPLWAQEIKIGLKSEPSALDPQFFVVTSNIQVASHMFESLTHLNERLQLQPALALSWKALSDLSWEFKLRPNVLFSDGSPFTAQDVVFSMERVPKVPNSPSPMTLYTRSIDRLEVVDPLTVRIHTKSPDPTLDKKMAFISIMSHKAASGPLPEGKSTVQLNAGDGLVGTGPFQFQSWQRGQEIVLVRNEKYWGTKPVWKKVTLRPLTNASARVSALLSGGVDLIEDPAIEDQAQIKRNAQFKVVQAASTRLIFLGTNVKDGVPPGVTGTQGKNPLKDARVRRAMSLAIDRKSLVDRVMDGGADAAEDLVNDLIAGVRPNATLPYDLEGAKKLMAEAGYGGGFGLLLGGPNGRYINDAKVLQAVASMWGRLGIKTAIQAEAMPVFAKNVSAGDTYSSFMLGWGDSDLSTRAVALLTTRIPEKGQGTANLGGYSNAEVDEWVTAANITLDETKRIALLQKATAKAAEETALIPLYFERSSWAMRKDIGYAGRADQMTLSQFVTGK